MAFNLTPTERRVTPNFDVSESFMRGFNLMESVKQQRFDNELEKARGALEERRVSSSEESVRLQGARDQAAVIESGFERVDSSARFDEDVAQFEKTYQAGRDDAEALADATKASVAATASYREDDLGFKRSAEERAARVFALEMEELEAQMKGEDYSLRATDDASRLHTQMGRDIPPVPSFSGTQGQDEYIAFVDNRAFVERMAKEIVPKLQAGITQGGPERFNGIKAYMGILSLAAIRADNLYDSIDTGYTSGTGRAVSAGTGGQGVQPSSGYKAPDHDNLLFETIGESGRPVSIQINKQRELAKAALHLETILSAIQAAKTALEARGFGESELARFQSDAMNAAREALSEGDLDPDVVYREGAGIAARLTSK